MSLGDSFWQECESLRTLVESVDKAGWSTPTAFYGWTIYDEIVHNHFLDLLAIEAIAAPHDFAKTQRDVTEQSCTDPDYSFRAYTNDRLGILSRDDVLIRWEATYNELADLLAGRDRLEKMPWFGPPMTLESCASARQMETWAHGQDIWDLLRRRRENTDRIRDITMLGIKTFGWSFANRKRALPPVKPFVVLSAPSGATWCWNDSQSRERVSGPAEDFCLVVTQRRHVDDTRLSVQGHGAREWLEIAQCFAGAPADGPAPGARLIRYADGSSL